MAKYNYKGVSLTTILDQNTNLGWYNPPKYSGLYYGTTTFANSKALATGYSVDGTDISSTARATHVTFNTAQAHVNIPTGCKTIRVIARGGGGGGGGGGGPANSRGGDDHAVRGQIGGSGGFGKIGYGSFNVVPGHNGIAIAVGGGGTGGGGAGGANVANGDVKAGDGGNGNTGGDSGVYYNSPAGWNYYGTGGGGGTGGTGGKAVDKDYGHGYSWSGAGTNGNTPFGITPQWVNGDPGLATAGANGSYEANYENSFMIGRGNGGGGGDGGYAYVNSSPWQYNAGSNVPGASGGNGIAGAVTVFWLYG